MEFASRRSLCELAFTLTAPGVGAIDLTSYTFCFAFGRQQYTGGALDCTQFFIKIQSCYPISTNQIIGAMDALNLTKLAPSSSTLR